MNQENTWRTLVLNATNARLRPGARGTEVAVNAFTETETPVTADEATDGPLGDESLAVAQTGAVSFSEVVRAHFDWDRAGCPDGPMRARFVTKLQAFAPSANE